MVIDLPKNLIDASVTLISCVPDDVGDRTGISCIGQGIVLEDKLYFLVDSVEELLFVGHFEVDFF